MTTTETQPREEGTEFAVEETAGHSPEFTLRRVGGVVLNFAERHLGQMHWDPTAHKNETQPDVVNYSS